MALQIISPDLIWSESEITAKSTQGTVTSISTRQGKTTVKCRMQFFEIPNDKSTSGHMNKSKNFANCFYGKH